MLSAKILKALNDQINQEMSAAYMYLSMSAYFSDIPLNGFAHWMTMQVQEELLHSQKLFDYVINRNSKVKLGPIAAPPASWKSPLAACKAAYQAEVNNTKQIYRVMDVAIKGDDHATRVILQWFVEEQVEEEATALDLVEQLKLAGNAPGAMLILDRELGGRTAAN